jgi:hypothetical protein
MSKIKIYLMFLFFILILISCEEWFIKDKEFSMKAIPYAGNELRIDGYYYKEANHNINRVYVFVFYANGIHFGGGGNKSFSGLEDRLSDPNYIANLQNCLSCWGPYQIKDNVLKFEYYEIFGNYWYICVANCEIINDSTFNIKRITRLDNNKNVSNNVSLDIGEYHFKQFSPKPDSTNYVVK